MIRKWRFRISAYPRFLALLLFLFLLPSAETACCKPLRAFAGPSILDHGTVPDLVACPGQCVPLDEASLDSIPLGLAFNLLLCPIPAVEFPGKLPASLFYPSFPSDPSFPRPPPGATPAIQQA